ncbi:MAG: XrtA/PEP-CTERM system-associated ATPase [Geobacteraceae bacterium]|nr:XrtA/PEP-CTERM system-associated ATPase [Geobacteraceae bacterium]
MYESFFNLKKKPFDLVPNPEFLFMSRSHRRALIHLDYGIHERAGFILLTGEVGSGKTTLIRDLIKKRPAGVLLSKIFNTSVNFEQFLAMVNDDFGLQVQGKDRTALLRDLNDFLIEQYSLGNRPTLIIDEAQNLTPELLEDIRMLSNLEADDAKLLQIIIVGQPELRKTLSLPSLLQLRQRISINCHLAPLTRPELEEYILHRLEVAGNREAVMFCPDSMDIIFRYSRGIPRLVNIICDFLMLSAFAEETRQIDEEMVRDVIGDLDFENQFWESGLPELGEILPFHGESSATGKPGGVMELLMDISERLSKLEKESIEFRETSLKEMGENLMSLGSAFRFYARETDAVVSELKALVEKQSGSDDASFSDEEGITKSVIGQQVLLAALKEKKLKKV